SRFGLQDGDIFDDPVETAVSDRFAAVVAAVAAGGLEGGAAIRAVEAQDLLRRPGPYVGPSEEAPALFDILGDLAARDEEDEVGLDLQGHLDARIGGRAGRRARELRFEDAQSADDDGGDRSTGRRALREAGPCRLAQVRSEGVEIAPVRPRAVGTGIQGVDEVVEEDDGKIRIEGADRLQVPQWLARRHRRADERRRRAHLSLLLLIAPDDEADNHGGRHRNTDHRVTEDQPEEKANDKA